MNKTILITGSTGNVGTEILRFLCTWALRNIRIVVTARNLKTSRIKFAACPSLEHRRVDFEDTSTFSEAFHGIDTLFLLRPPHISRVKEVFLPLIDALKKAGVREVVFLSVQGADKMGYIPHARIEKMLCRSGIDYVILRPSYFMQNLTTMLVDEVRSGKIVLPAGKGLFNWVDVRNIGEVAAHVLVDFPKYKNKIMEVTGSQTMSFPDAIKLINSTLNTTLEYESPNPFKYYRNKKREGLEKPFILVMMMLHFLPRFQKQPQASSTYARITRKVPTRLEEFVKREEQFFKSADPKNILIDIF